MDCTEIRTALQGLIDNSLDENELKAIKRHLPSCHGCMAEYRLLRRISSDLSGLPLFEPSREFNRSVFQRLGLDYKPYSLPAWISWSIAGSLSLLATWLIALAVGLPLLLMGLKSYRLVQWVQHPDMVIPSLQSALVKFGFALYDGAGFVVKVFGWFLKASSAPAQLAIASLIAFGIIALAMRTMRPQARTGLKI